MSDRATVHRLEALIGRPAPAPRPHFPELSGKLVRARCTDVAQRFNQQWGRLEVHLFFEVLEGEAAGETFWGKLNYPKEIRHGHRFYTWYCALVGVPPAGEPMSYEDFRGVEASVRLRTSKSSPPYTVVDVKADPVLLGGEAPPLPPVPLDPDP